MSTDLSTIRRQFAGGSGGFGSPSEVGGQEGDVVFDAGEGGFADDGGVGVADDLEEERRVDLAGAEVLVAVAAGAGGVLGVVGVHEVDAPGDRLDALGGAGHGFAGGVGVARVE